MNSKVLSPIYKVSEGIYKKYLENRLGVRVCHGKLKDKEIEDLLEDLELLKYISCDKSCNINEDKLIEALT